MKYVYFTFLLSVIFLFHSCKEEGTEPNGENCTIEGNVSDFYTNEGLEGVEINTFPTTINVVTNSSGDFLINGIMANNYLIIASKSNYLSDTLNVDFSTGNTETCDFKLRIRNSLKSHFELLFPPNNESEVDLITRFVWHSCSINSDYNTTYDVFIGESQTELEQVGTVTDTFFVYSGFKKAHKYYWKVVAIDESGNTIGSDIWSVFTTSTQKYIVQLPEGKLPLPVHYPEYTQEQYDAMINSLFIINNFGQDQFRYLHDGLDLVFPNGTKIVAVDSGYVRWIDNRTENYKSVVIEDITNPGYGWSYVHVDNFKVTNGDKVVQGQPIAAIKFLGIEHIHLQRVKLRAGGIWSNIYDLFSLQCDKYFEYIDTKPPLIKTPFYFFRNNTDTQFLGDGIKTVSGDVDIVVGMREIGEYAMKNGLGDRLAVTDIRYKITKSDGEVVLEKKSFDFSKLLIDFRNTRAGDAMIYKDYTLIEGRERVGMEWSEYYSYYIITNHEYHDEERGLELENTELSWKTAKLNSDGSRKFPNGEYLISVTARDFKGNSVIETDSVIVEN